MIMRYYYQDGNYWNTTIHIQNAGTTPANVYVYFYKQNGTWKATDGPYSIQPGASIELNQANDGELGSSFMGSAKIYSSNQPVAAITTIANTNNNRAAAYNAFATGATSISLPLIYDDFHGLDSKIQVQNIGGSGTNTAVAY